MTERQDKSAVWKTLGVYTAGSWVALQAIDLLADNIGLPSWVFTSALVLLVLGLPIVGITSYLQGLRPSREKSAGSTAAVSGTRTLFTWRNALFGGLAAFALWGLVAAGWLILRGLGPDTDRTATEDDGSVPTGALSVSTMPPGADVHVSRIVNASEATIGDPLHLGRSPIESREVPAGMYVVEVLRDGSNSLVLLATIDEIGESRISVELVMDAPQTRSMVLVPKGPAPAGLGGVPMGAFLVDRHEVTNEEFARFVGDQGYEIMTLWPDSMFVGSGKSVRGTALEQLVDRSGASGPRAWSGSLYPPGMGSYPVTGVSWYEANAYCLWVGKRLPTARQWWRAALGSAEHPYPWGPANDEVESRAAFNLSEPRPTESYPLGVSPFGAFDMAGNAREWVQPDPAESERAPSIGGSWQAPEYTFGIEWQEELPLGFADETTGFRCVRHTE